MLPHTGKVFETVICPSMMYGIETMALTKQQAMALEGAEMNGHAEFFNECHKFGPRSAMSTFERIQL